MKGYEKFGIAALIPGMQHMVDLMQRELDDMRKMISSEDTKIPKKILGDRKKQGTASKAYWAKMTPEQRSTEMRRRMQVAKRRKAKEATA